ncbi:hypothetical protein D3C72_1269920 [compost metagenome]
MVGMAFQVQGVVQYLQHFSLAGAGQATDQDKIALGDGALGGIKQEVTHGLVATNHFWVLNTSFCLEPLLGDLRAQAATKTVEVAFRIGPGEGCPGGDTLIFALATDQLVAQGDGGLLALLLVAGANLLPLHVVHQWQVDHIGKGALGKLDRGAHVHHRDIVQKQLAVVGAVVTHHSTSTAWLCRSTSSPIGARLRPSSVATARNSASPSGVTATSRPPLVCGSHNRCFCSSLSGAIFSP